MIDLKDIQKQIIQNRTKRNWSSATDLSKTTEGLAEELGEFTKARRHKDQAEMIDALGDLMVWCLGGIEILGVDSEDVIEKIVKNNASRIYGDNHY